jgi:hypothetical protein
MSTFDIQELEKQVNTTGETILGPITLIITSTPRLLKKMKLNGANAGTPSVSELSEPSVKMAAQKHPSGPPMTLGNTRRRRRGSARRL